MKEPDPPDDARNLAAGLQTANHLEHRKDNENAVTEEEFKAGFQYLSELSEQEYHKSLSDCISEAYSGSPFYGVGRLIGVSIKEPFAVAQILDSPSTHSLSFRTLDLRKSRLQEPSRRETWQYQTLEEICRELSRDGRTPTVLQLAEYAKHEIGFFGYLARSAARYICADTELRKKINKSVAEAKTAGFNAKHLRPEVLVQAGGLALGSHLITHIPVFAYVGAPVIAGFVLVLYSIGADAYCSYVRDYIHDKQQAGLTSDDLDFSSGVGKFIPERKPPWEQKDRP
jgi:hypothetical protein